MKAKKRIYIETTVISYAMSRVSRDVIVASRQLASRMLLDRCGEFEAFISVLVISEIKDGDPSRAALRCEVVDGIPVLRMSERAEQLAGKLIQAKAVPAKFKEDALHLAIAAVNGIDVIVTLNFAHINNPFTLGRIREVVEREGYRFPEVSAPDVLVAKYLEVP
jgi:predicted nucleic acid-binding protein